MKVKFRFHIHRCEGVCYLCFNKCKWEGGGQVIGDYIVSAAFVCFGAAKSVVSKYVMLFVAFARYFVREDW